MAIRILRMNGDTQPLGVKWVSYFLQRNTRVHSIVGRSIEASRARVATPEMIREFLELFERTRRCLNIPPEAVYNMDETGIALGVCNNAQVLASAHKKKAYIKSPENREWVSIIESVSATGQRLRPAIIFKGHHLQTSWFPSRSIPDWLYTSSENGWTSYNIGLAWLQQIFIPETTSPLGSNRLLILDGHSSHADIDFMWDCYQHNIHILYLPAHSSHILQPLDLAPFSVIKSKYRKQIADLAALDDAAPIKKESFITIYDQARRSGLAKPVIQAGWRATGLVPYDLDRVISSSQVQTRPATPPAIPRSIQAPHPIYSTPKRSQDLYRHQKTLERSENISRSTRVLLGKASKAISIANTRAAKLESINTQLQHQLNKIKITKPKKRTPIDQNERFRNIEAIKLAIEAVTTKEAIKATNDNTKLAAKPTNDSVDNSFDSMCIQFQI